jgi:hypothetical protein
MIPIFSKKPFCAIILFPLSISLLIIFQGCKKKGDYEKWVTNPVLYNQTVKKLNDVVLENNFPPMIASRNYVYACIAGYECIAAGDSSFKSLSGQIKHLPAMPSPKIIKGEINYELAALLSFTKVGNAVTFPEGSLMDYHAELLRLADSAGMPSSIIKASVAFSDTISSAILLWSKGDRYGATRGDVKFNVTDEPGRWVPTPPLYASAVEPHWKKIRPMVLDSTSQFSIPRPPAFKPDDKTSSFYKAMLDVKETGDNLTVEQKEIADFWDDNPFRMNVSGHVMFATKKFSPPGHWLNIVGIAAETAGADFRTTVAAYAQTSIAFFDAFIRGWEEKYKSVLIRPETSIQQWIDPNWKPYIQTPPFPSYVSGHATNSAAAAEVMTNWFGDALAIRDTSLVEFGIKARNLKSFRLAAEEAAMSRLYGGIHYRFDNDEGLKAGKQIGNLITQRLTLKLKK